MKAQGQGFSYSPSVDSALSSHNYLVQMREANMNYVSETGYASQNTQKQTIWNNCALMSFIILSRDGPGEWLSQH